MKKLTQQRDELDEQIEKIKMNLIKKQIKEQMDREYIGSEKMNWTQFFKEYCTLSDENNTPKGTIKEYSTKGRKLNIHWTCNDITGLEFGELKEIIFIQHLREMEKTCCIQSHGYITSLA